MTATIMAKSAKAISVASATLDSHPDHQLGRLRLPKHLVDADWLCEMLGYETAAKAQLGADSWAKLQALENAVERARLFGLIKRYIVRNPDNRKFYGFCYRRDDVLRIMRQKKSLAPN